ncbi:hypothetical protein GOODEAATRI_019175 [Goodea atripinnis]|uniref:Uncharacterized protein n=1 Tax=Goodea atripinnis TaxID=208336 RepID=A0ABV0P645_9TELE
MLVFDPVSRIWFMPQPAPCLTSLVQIIDPVSVPGLLSQPSPLIIQPKVTCLSYLLCGGHCLPTEVSPLGFKFYPRQKQVSDFSDPCNIWRNYKSLIPLSAPVIPISCVEFYLSDVFLWLNKPFKFSVLCLAESWVRLFLIRNRFISTTTMPRVDNQENQENFW